MKPGTGRDHPEIKICPGCKESVNIVKYGIRHTSKGSVQKYHCTRCGYTRAHTLYLR